MVVLCAFFLFFFGLVSCQQYQTIEETMINRTCVYKRDVAGFIDYWWLVHCVSTPVVQAILLVLWLIYLLYMIISTTHKYFGNAISYLTERLHLSSHIFGVTFLAISFVSGDFFISLAAIYHHSNDVALGGILGSSFFTLTVGVAIAIFFYNEKVAPRVPRRPFYRDIVILIATALILALFWMKNDMRLWQGILMLTIYLFYLLIVLIGRFVYQRQKLKQRTELGILEDVNDVLFEMSPDTDIDHVMFFADIRENANKPFDTEYELVFNFDDSDVTCCSHLGTFWRQLTFDGSGWHEKTILKKFAFLFIAPSIIARNLTIPTGAGIIWSKPLIMINCFTAPQFVLAVSETIHVTIQFGSFPFPLWGLLLIISAIMSLILFFTSSITEPPKYYSLLVVLNIVLSVTWLYTVGLEFVSGLIVLCLMSHFSTASGGVIFLGVANSFIAVTTLVKLSRQGFINMAISSILAVVPLKLMFCVGFSIIFVSAINGEEGVYFSEGSSANPLLLTFVSLVGTGVALAVVLPIFRFKLKVGLGIVSVVLWMMVMVVVVLTEVGIIFPNPILGKNVLGF